jgi:hypothetical protein
MNSFWPLGKQNLFIEQFIGNSPAEIKVQFYFTLSEPVTGKSTCRIRTARRIAIVRFFFTITSFYRYLQMVHFLFGAIF